ncbi:MAG: hypothetical protein LBB49_03960, partial [Gracilibacteraceae bacterium]|nr:hypothetical protein [Gracilibacteraceae bacterium]
SALSLAGPLEKDNDNTLYAFDGWKDNTTGDRYSVGEEVNLVSDMTLTAIWQAIAPPVYNGNMIPNGDFEAYAPRSMNGTGTRTGTNIYTLETGSANLTDRNETTALRVEEQERDAFAAFPVSLERGKTYNFKFDIMLLEDNHGNTVLNNYEVPVVFRFTDPSKGDNNHFVPKRYFADSGAWKTIEGSYSVVNDLPDNATPEDTYFAFYVHTPIDANLQMTYLIDNVKVWESGKGEESDNMIPNGDFELPIQFGNFGDPSLNGTSAFQIETRPHIINIGGSYNEKAALRVQQNTNNAFAGYPVPLEWGCTYEYKYDIMLLQDSEERDVTNLDVVTNFVFSDKKATNHNQNHLIVFKDKMSTGTWKTVKGSFTADPTKLDANATPWDAWFSIYVHRTPDLKSVTYVIDNVSLVKAIDRTPKTKELLTWLNRENPKPALGGYWYGAREGSGETSTPHKIEWALQKDILGKDPLVFGFNYHSAQYNYTAYFGAVSYGNQLLSREETRQYIIDKANQGGIITMTDHMPNFVTYDQYDHDISAKVAQGYGDAWDSWVYKKEDKKEDQRVVVIPRIMPGGSHHDAYKAYLDELADYLLDLKTDDGELIPILYRPFHEMNGNWFWWGQSKVKDGKRESVELWRFTWEYLTYDKGLRHLIWVWAPDIVATTPNWRPYWPGSMYVDVVAMDAYIEMVKDENDNAVLPPNTPMLDNGGSFSKCYRHLEQIASEEGGLPIAIAETGFKYSNKREAAVWLEKYPAFLDSLDVKPRYLMFWSGTTGALGSYTNSADRIDDENNFREFVLPSQGEPRFLLMD